MHPISIGGWSKTGELLNTYKGYHKAGEYQLDVQVLGDDSSIVTGSEDGTCCLYDLVQATCVQSLKNNNNNNNNNTNNNNNNNNDNSESLRPVCSIATHPKQGSAIITADFDSNATIWTRNK